MSVRELLGVLNALGFLALGCFCFWRGGRSPLARPLGLLSLVVFGWACPELAFAPERFWRALDLALTPWTPYLVLDFVLVFVGQRTRLRWLRWASALAFGMLSLGGVVAFASPRVLSAFDGTWAAAALVAFSLPTLACELVLLRAHAVRQSDAREVGRTRVLGWAIGLATLSAGSDLASDVGVVAIRLAPVGWLGALGLAALVVFRLDLFERVRAGARDPRRELMLVGRFAAQMSHDLGNPLTALHGACHLLPADFEFADLMREQVERMREILARYARLSRVEPERSRFAIAPLVRRCVDRARALAKGDATFTVDAPADELVWLDETLVETVFDGLLVNAIEASANAAAVEVTVTREGAALHVVVSDHGSGMNARDAERATEDFFTTKTTGSGLGLAFARRVAEAHGGRLSLRSTLGEGTTIELWMPCDRVSSPP